LQVLAARGIRVPEDMSVTGFEDTQIAAYLAPPLTSVSIDVVAWGARAAESLLAVVDGDDPGELELPEPELIVRGSTGPAP
jgi:LacI family transcriptional regulator, repressor for deo operon, udp, cdd, tsx, nupC, and nupG